MQATWARAETVECSIYVVDNGHVMSKKSSIICLVSVFGFVFVFVFGALPLSFCLYLILSLCLYLCLYLMLSVKSDGRSPCALSWFDICF